MKEHELPAAAQEEDHQPEHQAHNSHPDRQRQNPGEIVPHVIPRLFERVPKLLGSLPVH